MKRTLLPIILIFSILIGCSAQSDYVSSRPTQISEQSQSSQESTVENNISSDSVNNASAEEPRSVEQEASDISDDNQDTKLEIPDGAIKVEIDTALVDKSGITKDGTVKLSMYIPINWSVKNAEIFEDERIVAKFQLVNIITNKAKAFEDINSQYADAIACSDFSSRTYSGKYYHLQNEITDGGITAKYNEIIYCLNDEDRLITIMFYPAFGIGIGTQREEFESYLKTLN